MMNILGCLTYNLIIALYDFIQGFPICTYGKHETTLPISKEQSFPVHISTGPLVEENAWLAF